MATDGFARISRMPARAGAWCAALLGASLLWCGPAGAQDLDEFTAEGGLKVLRDSGFAEDFDDTLGWLGRRRQGGGRGDVDLDVNSKNVGKELASQYREGWLEYLESKGAKAQNQDFLGRRAGRLNKNTASKVYRLENYEFWLETKNVRGSGPDLDLVVWELDIDGNGRVREAKGVGSDVHTRHPLDKWADGHNREHYRTKVIAAEAHVQEAARRGINTRLDVGPDRSFYWKDHVLERTAADRFAPGELDDHRFWTGKSKASYRDRDGFLSVRDAIGVDEAGSRPLTTDDPRFKPAARKDALAARNSKALRRVLTTLGLAAASFATMESAAAAEAFAKPESKARRILELAMAEDWVALERMLAQPGLNQQLRLEFAEANARAPAIAAEEFIEAWRDVVARAKARQRTYAMAKRIHLGDGRWAADSADASAMTDRSERGSWTGRMDLPEGGMRRPTLLVKELRGADRSVEVVLNGAWLADLSNGKEMEVPIPLAGDETELRIQFRAGSSIESGIDDLDVIEPSIRYELLD